MNGGLKILFYCNHHVICVCTLLIVAVEILLGWTEHLNGFLCLIRKTLMIIFKGY